MTAPPHRPIPGAPRPPPARRRSPARLMAAGVLTASAAVAVLPDLLFGLDRRSPFAQLVAFRPTVLCGLLALVLITAGIAVVRRRAWPFPVGLLAVALVAGAMVLPRAVPDPVPPGGRPLTVLAFNTFEGEADVAAVAELIRTHRPDLVALVEAGGRYDRRLAPLVEPLGYVLHPSGSGGPDVDAVTAITRHELGDVRVDVDHDTMPFPSVQVSGGELGELRFVAFHSVAPTPDAVPQWRADVASLQRWCADGPPTIIAGDLNASLDHSVLRSGAAGCADAAEQAGEGLVGTWHTRAPRWLGSQIDHVLTTGGIVAEELTVHDVPGSDHRAVLTRLRLPS